MSPKQTQQRTALLRTLEGAGGFRSAQELHDLARENGETLGLATVYRALRAMTESGEVDVLHPPGGDAIYRLCESTEHHHHLVCRSCGKTVEIESPDVEEWARRVASRHQFRAVVHSAELFGVCATCADSPSARSPRLTSRVEPDKRAT